MRQRITYIQDPQDAIDPATLHVTSTSISRNSLKAAREEKITLGLDELPEELLGVLRESHELHVRWASEISYDSVVPFVSRISPGLHVFYTPQRGSNSSILLCPLLSKVFGDGVSCVSPGESFTKLPTERFSHSAALQYYTPLPSLTSLHTYLQHHLCTPPTSSCSSRLSALSTATSLDTSYDTISHALTLSLFTPSTTRPLDISLPKTTLPSRLEVGILAPSPGELASSPEELTLSGFLTVLSESTKPSPTLFSFPSRHHPSTSFFSSSFLQPTSLHPTLLLSITDSTPPMEDRKCAIHAHLTLPNSIFLDKYQFSDPLFLGSKNLTALHYSTTPVDLEAPVYAVKTWGSTALLELSPPLPTPEGEGKWTSQIPLHLRYLPPSSNSSGLTSLTLPYPVLFWACTADEGSKFVGNPFDRSNLGYDGLFGPRTLFFHLNPRPQEEGGKLVSRLDVPVLDLDGSRYVEVGTGVVVLMGLMWVLWCLVRVGMGSGFGRIRREEMAKGGAEGKKDL